MLNKEKMSASVANVKWKVAKKNVEGEVTFVIAMNAKNLFNYKRDKRDNSRRP